MLRRVQELAHQSQLGKIAQESSGAGSPVPGRKKVAEESPGAGSPVPGRKKVAEESPGAGSPVPGRKKGFL